MAKKSDASAVMPSPSAADRKREDEWQIEEDARTLKRAMEIRKDKNRLRKVRAWAAEQAAIMKSATA